MVVLGSAGVLRVTLVTSAGTRGTGWDPGVSSGGVCSFRCGHHAAILEKVTRSRKKQEKLPSYMYVCMYVLLYMYVHMY